MNNYHRRSENIATTFRATRYVRKIHDLSQQIHRSKTLLKKKKKEKNRKKYTAIATARAE